LLISRFRLPQLFTEERDGDEKGYNNRPDNRRTYNGVGRQTGAAEALTTKPAKPIARRMIRVGL
jgi:hypothetical protein